MFAVKGFSSVLLLFSSVLVARVIDLDEFGIYSFITSLLTVLAFFALWGTDRLCLREVSTKKADSTFSSGVADTVTSSYAVVILNLIIISFGIFILLPKYTGSNEVWIPIVAVSILFFRALSRLSTSIIKGLHRVILSEILLNLLRPAVFVALLIAALIFTGGITALTALWFLCVSFFLTSLLSIIYILKKHPFSFSLSFCKIRKTYSISAAFFIIGIGLPLLSEINTIELGILGTDEQVALFSAARRIVTAVLLGLVSANLIISPKIAPLYRSKDYLGLTNLIRTNNRYVLLITIVPAVLLFIFSDQAMYLFGEEYVAASNYLRIMLIGQLASVFCGPVLLVASLADLQRWASGTLLTSCAVSFIMCEVLIPKYGVYGAVYSAVAGVVLLNIVLATLIRYKLGVNTTMINILKTS